MKVIITGVFLVLCNIAFAQGFQMPPYYWGIAKTDAMKSADAQYIAEASAEFAGDLVEAGKERVRLGWQMLDEDDPETAVRRFNQAWLLDPNNPGVPYGLMISTHIRGDSDSVIHQLFELSTQAMKPEDQYMAYLDYARMLVERGRARDSKILLEQRIETANDGREKDYYHFLAVACASIDDGECFEAAKAKAEE